MTALIAVLEAKFGGVHAEVEAAVRGCADLAALRAWTAQAATAATLDDFRAASGLPGS